MAARLPRVWRSGRDGGLALLPPAAAVPASHEGAAPSAGGTKRRRRGPGGPGRAAAHRPFKAGA